MNVLKKFTAAMKKKRNWRVRGGSDREREREDRKQTEDNMYYDHHLAKCLGLDFKRQTKISAG